MKNKLKILLNSIFTLILMIGIVVGATYSLFTSESKVKIDVLSGNVDVEATIGSDLKLYSFDVLQKDCKFENDGSAMVNSDGVLVIDRMSPGDKIVFDINVRNLSDMSIRYRVNVASNGTLFDALKCSAVLGSDGSNLIVPTGWIFLEPKGSIENITVILEFPNAINNNDYKNKQTEIYFTVEAVQANGVEFITNALDLAKALKNGKIVVLKTNIELTESLEVPIGVSSTLDLNGYTITVIKDKDTQEWLYSINNYGTF